MTSNDDRDIKNHTLCTNCIGDMYLRRIVEDEGENRICSYCDRIGQTFLLDEISERVKVAFKDHFIRTADEPSPFEYALLKDKEIEYEWEREGEPTVYAIMNAADIPEEAAKHVQEILADNHYDFDKAAMGEESDFSRDAYYAEIMPGDEEWQKGWKDFERTIKSESRFFSSISAEQLNRVFDRIDQMQTRMDQPLIVSAGPGTELTHFHRARIFQSDEKLRSALIRPDLELGAPPTDFASAGRMNASGISVFYGSTDAQIALAEVRPPIGSQVAVARFEIIRPIRLLDLAALGQAHESGSVFDESYAPRLSRMMFLRSLSTRISRPIMPDDQESDYLPTQVIADFLASEGKLALDGILFPSVQMNTKGLNAVLFHKAARCEEIQIPEGTEFDACTHSVYKDEVERDYQVTEIVPAEDLKPDKKQLFNPTYLSLIDDENFNDREITLRIDLDTVQVHVVNAVKFETSDFMVSRHRLTKEDMPF